jgi:hypothetical protein
MGRAFQPSQEFVRYVRLVQAYLFDLLPDTCRGLVNIRMPGTHESNKWKILQMDF